MNAATTPPLRSSPALLAKPTLNSGTVTAIAVPLLRARQRRGTGKLVHPDPHAQQCSPKDFHTPYSSSVQRTAKR